MSWYCDFPKASSMLGKHRRPQPEGPSLGDRTRVRGRLGMPDGERRAASTHPPPPAGPADTVGGHAPHSLDPHSLYATSPASRPSTLNRFLVSVLLRLVVPAAVIVAVASQVRQRNPLAIGFVLALASMGLVWLGTWVYGWQRERKGPYWPLDWLAARWRRSRATAEACFHCGTTWEPEATACGHCGSDQRAAR
jgi:hypothetical protein